MSVRADALGGPGAVSAWATRRRPSFPPVARTHHRLAFVAALLAGWEVVVRLGIVDRRFVSPPSQVVPTTVTLLRDEAVRAALLDTGRSVLQAFALAAVVGVALGSLLGLSRLAAEALGPIVRLLFATPKMVLIPVYILLFGLGGRASYLFGFSLGVFPIILTTTTAVKGVDPSLDLAARSMGATAIERFRHVLVPAAFPDLLTGLRIGLVQTLLGVLLAELYGSVAGVGYFASLFSQSFQTDKTFALFFLVSSMAVAVNAALAALERRAGAWRDLRAGT